MKRFCPKFAHCLFKAIYIQGDVGESLQTAVVALSRVLTCKLFLFFTAVALCVAKNKMCLQIAWAFKAMKKKGRVEITRPYLTHEKNYFEFVRFVLWGAPFMSEDFAEKVRLHFFNR